MSQNCSSGYVKIVICTAIERKKSGNFLTRARGTHSPYGDFYALDRVFFIMKIGQKIVIQWYYSLG